MPSIFQGGIASWMFEQICVVHLLQIWEDLRLHVQSVLEVLGAFNFIFLNVTKT
jgi:hypothetical protein